MLAFWNDGKPRKVRSNSQVKLPNGDIVLNAKPDPDNDLYEYVDVGPMPDRKYEVAGPVTYDNDGWTITATRSVMDRNLDQVKAERFRDIKMQRDTVVNAGIEWTPDDVTTYIVQTDSDSRQEITGAVVAINEDAIPEQAWRMLDNQIVVLPSTDFKRMGVAVRDHVNACYLNQAMLEAVVNAGSDIEAVKSVDVTEGWPPHYVAPEIAE